MVDVTSSMQHWFRIGMYIMLVSMFYSVVVFGYQATKSEVLAKAANLVSCIQGLVLLVWVIYGTMIRFSNEGKACSGSFYQGSGEPDPYMWNTGIFMAVYIILVYVCIGLVFCCGCIVGLGFTLSRHSGS